MQLLRVSSIPLFLMDSEFVAPSNLFNKLIHNLHSNYTILLI